MSSTSSHLPICVHCGTARPADETLCPKCAEPWIDVSVTDVTRSVAPGTVPGARSSLPAPTPVSPVRASEETGEFDFDEWTLPPDRRSSRAKWFVPLILLLAVVGTWALVLVDRDGSSAEPTVAVLETTITQSPTTTDAPPATTQPTTTTSAPTTTTVPYPPVASWAPVGDPIPTPELSLKASGIGPIIHGMSLADAAGRLVASFGEPDAAGLDLDICPSSELYWLQWGDFRALFDGYTDGASFVAYRYERTGTTSAGPELETLSGIRLGDTVEAFQSTYVAFTISFEVMNDRNYFKLSNGGELLLWGPVTSTEPRGTIEGVYSPDSCETDG